MTNEEFIARMKANPKTWGIQKVNNEYAQRGYVMIFHNGEYVKQYPYRNYQDKIRKVATAIRYCRNHPNCYLETLTNRYQ